jgi:O-antigen ligase
MSNTERSAPADVGEWAVALLLAANWVWTTLCLGGYRPETMTVSWALTGAALAVQLGLAAFEGEKPHPAGWWLLPFLGYGLFNVFTVSPVRWLAWLDYLNWIQIVAIFWTTLNGVKSRGPRWLLAVVLLGLAVVSVMLASYQRFLWPDWLTMGRHQAAQFIGRASGPFGIPNSLGAFMLFVIPPLFALTWQRGASAIQRILCGYLAALFLLGLGLSISRGAMLALLAAMTAWPLFFRDQSWAVRGMLASLAFAGALMIGVVAYNAVPQVQQRFDALASDRGEKARPILWLAAWQLFEDAPLLGTGAGSYNVLFDRYRPEFFRDEPQWAHNDYLNTLSDYGLIGFILVFGGFVTVAVKTGQQATRQSKFDAALGGWRSPEITGAAAVGLMAFGFAALVDFHLKIPALGMTAALVAAEIVKRCWPKSSVTEATPGRQLGQLLAAVGVVVFTLGLALPVYRSEASRYPARQAIDHLALLAEPTINQQKAVYSESAALLSEAIVFDEENAQAWADRSYVSSLWSHLATTRMNELGREAESAARQALKRSTVVPEFWIRLGVSLDMQGKWSEAGSAFVRALNLAPASPNAWYYQAYHLSLIPAARHLAKAANETCLRLDPNHRSGLALRRRLSSSP